MRNVKQKIMGIFTAFLLAALVVSPASAALTGSVSTSANIQTVNGITLDKSALNFNINAFDVFVSASEGNIGITNIGNTHVNIFGKMASAQSGLTYQADGVNLGTTDIKIFSLPLEDLESSTIGLKVKASGIGPGIFTNTFTVTGVPV